VPSYPGFIGPTYQGQNISMVGEECINLVPELIQSGHGANDAKYNYYGRPGKTLFATLTDTPVRAMWSGNNRLFAVGGSTLFEVLSDGSITTSTGGGSIGGADGPAQIVSNGNELLVWDGSAGSDGAFNTWLATGSQPPFTVINSVGITYLDGYFIALRPGGSDSATDPIPVNTGDQTQINLSALLDGSTWDPLQYAIKGGEPSPILMINAPGSPGGGYEELYLMCEKSIEVWQDTGGTSLDPFPLQRIPGAFINQGIWAPFTIVALDNTIFWLGGDERGNGVVWRMNGYIPQRVSTFAVEYLMQQYQVSGQTIGNAVAYAMQENGHQLYVLNFPGGYPTLVYDVTTDMWHKRTSGSTLGALSNDLGFYHAFTFGMHLLGDPNSGNIYASSASVYQDNGNPIVWSRTAPHVNNAHIWTDQAQLELLFGGPFTSSRTFTLDTSNDGGFNFGSSRSATFPAASPSSGPAYQRAVWRRFSRSRDRVARITTTDNLQQAWLDCIINPQAGTGN
jgi:hypothetical protein